MWTPARTMANGQPVDGRSCEAGRFSMRRPGINYSSATVTNTGSAIRGECSATTADANWSVGDILPFHSRPAAFSTIEVCPCEGMIAR